MINNKCIELVAALAVIYTAIFSASLQLEVGGAIISSTDSAVAVELFRLLLMCSMVKITARKPILPGKFVEIFPGKPPRGS
eukprot:1179028-Pyramimonas_sp.AAC.1